MKCDMCHKDKSDVSTQPSRSQLIFGGFNVKYENRCNDCEREVRKRIDKMLKHVP